MKLPLFYSLPPAGHKIPFTTIIRSIKEIRNDSHDTFIEALSSFLGIKNILYLSSGRAALWLILKTISKIAPQRREVILPAYTCPAIVSAVLKAGLKPVLCDINLDNFGFNTENLKLKIGENTLAVIVVHLFGYPANIDEVKECCRGQGIFVIEDAAQGFGNSLLDKERGKLGLLGDAGFFSFGRGKPISIFHGGVLVTNSDVIFLEARKIYENLYPMTMFQNIRYMLTLGTYLFLSSPYLYWIPQRIPFLHLGETIFEPEFQTSQGIEWSALLIAKIIESIEEEKEIRKGNSQWYYLNLENLPYIRKPQDYDFPYLRYPLLIEDQNLRNRILEKLVSSGTGASLFYPCALNQLIGLKEILQDSNIYPNGKKLANSLITLPVHSGVSLSHRMEIRSIIQEVIHSFNPKGEGKGRGSRQNVQKN